MKRCTVIRSIEGIENNIWQQKKLHHDLNVPFVCSRVKSCQAYNCEWKKVINNLPFEFLLLISMFGSLRAVATASASPFQAASKNNSSA